MPADTTTESKSELESGGCVFCEILAGEREATVLARRDGAAALVPLPDGRLSDAHILVIPTLHAQGVHEATPDALFATMQLVQDVARALRAALGAAGVNVLNASGPHSDQSVPHLHFHVVPRWENDGLDTWPTMRSKHAVDTGWDKEVSAQLAVR